MRDTAFFKATAASAFALALAFAPFTATAEDSAAKAAAAAENMAQAAENAAEAADAMSEAAGEMSAAAEGTADDVEQASETAASTMAGEADAGTDGAEDVAQTAQADTEAPVEEAEEAAEAAGDAVPDYEQNISLDFVVTGEDGTEYTGDPEAGSRVFRRCMQCHLVQPGQHRQGPSLYGLLGREAGTVEGYTRYSAANKNSGIVWTKQALFEYLENPRQYIRGTTMAFPGLRTPQERADVIAYIIEQTLEN